MPTSHDSPNDAHLTGDHARRQAPSLSAIYRAVTARRDAASCAWSGGKAPHNCQLHQQSELFERQLRALLVITALLGTRQEQDAKLEQILDVLHREFALLRGTVMLLSADGSSLHVEAVHGKGDAEKVSYRRGEGITGQVLETAQPAIIEDITNEPDFTDRIHKRRESATSGTAFVCVPVIDSDRRCIGTLAADCPHDSDLPLGDVQSILVIVASMIANHVYFLREAQQQQNMLNEENLRLRAALGERFAPENMVGRSGPMRGIYRKISQVGESTATVLIRGESGTGKELVASAIHYASPRKEKPLVRVNCAALNENLLESELFGHEKGAFTGATQQRTGRIEEAEGGSLFLDEIGEFSPAIQVKLLRVLQEREYQRVGSSETHAADVRIIAATNRDLEEAVRMGDFREDLYYRINVFPIMLPPLRERREDILELANHFLAKHGGGIGKQVTRISTSAIDALMAYHWPGNVRELENCIEYALVTCKEGVIHGCDLPPTLQMPDMDGMALHGTMPLQVERLERDLISDALKRNGGTVTSAARELGVTARILRYKIKNYGIRAS